MTFARRSGAGALSSGSLFERPLLAIGLICILARVTPSLATGQWTAWANVLQCADVSCGVQPRQARRRICEDSAPLPDGAPLCTTGSVETDSIDCGELRPCTGNWSAWSAPTACRDICDVGELKRFRTCDSDNSSITSPECPGGNNVSTFVRTESCTIAQPRPPASRRELEFVDLPMGAHVGGVSVLICCLRPNNATAQLQIVRAGQALMARRGLLLESSASRLEAVFSSLEPSDGTQYRCGGSAGDDIDDISSRLVVLPRPTEPMTAGPTSGIAFISSRTPSRVTTAQSATTTPATAGGDNQDDGGTSSSTYVAIFVPVGVFLIIALTVIAAVVWHQKSNQVFVGRRDISGDAGVQRVAVISAKRAYFTRSKKKAQPEADVPVSDQQKRLSYTLSDV